MTPSKLSDLPWSRMGIEAAIIVASILVALGVDEWRQDRENRQLETVYLGRLVEDLDVNLGILDRQASVDAGKIENARHIFPLVSKGEWQGLTRESVVIASYRASPVNTPEWVDDTFEELKSTGHLVLIQDSDVRRAIISYYRFLETRDWAYQFATTDYRNMVRGRMNPDLQLAIRAQCFDQTGVCQADLQGLEYDDYLEWLTDNDQLADGLTRVITQWTRAATEYLPAARLRTIELKMQLENRLGPVAD